METSIYKTDDFRFASNELLAKYAEIYDAEANCSELANILARSRSKWAEYSIRDLCLSQKNFEFIDSTSMKKLGRHSIPFSEILRLIYLCESKIPYDSRVKIYTYEDSVTIQIVHHFSIIVKNPYEKVFEIEEEGGVPNLSKRLFCDSVLERLGKILQNLDFDLYLRASIFL